MWHLFASGGGGRGGHCHICVPLSDLAARKAASARLFLLCGSEKTCLWDSTEKLPKNFKNQPQHSEKQSPKPSNELPRAPKMHPRTPKSYPPGSPALPPAPDTLPDARGTAPIDLIPLILITISTIITAPAAHPSGTTIALQPLAPAPAETPYYYYF